MPSKIVFSFIAAFSVPALLAQATGNQYPPTSNASHYPSASARVALPPVMHICPAQTTVCGTWALIDGHYNGGGEWGVSSTMAVQSFTPDSVVINRIDPRTGYKAVYTGKISGGDSIVNGDWKDSRGNTGHFTATWGAALRDLPPPQPKTSSQNPSIDPRAVMSVLSMFFGGGAGGGEQHGDPDLPHTISTLKDQRESARTECGNHGGQNARDPSPACARADQLSERLADAIAALNQEISDLQDARGDLVAACNRSNSSGC
jgi:hypothetical protein